MHTLSRRLAGGWVIGAVVGCTALGLLLSSGPLLPPAPGPGPPAAFAKSAAARPDSLVILHSNDTHAHLLPFRPEGGGERVGGAAARAALIARERGRSPGGRTILLDAGDAFQGTPYYNYFRGVPDYKTMAAMRYDVLAVGNHDLDDGPRGWMAARAGLDLDFVCANLFAAADSAWAKGLSAANPGTRLQWIGGGRVPEGTRLAFLARPYMRLEPRPGLRIAVFGLITPDLVRIVTPRPNGGVAVGDPVAAARELVPLLRREADVVICISHLGVGDDKKLAERVSGIDLIVGGHNHAPLWKPILVRNGTPNGYGGTAIVQAGRWGQYLGRTVLYFTDGKATDGKATRYAGSLLRVSPSEGEDAAIASLLRPYTDSIEARVGRPIFHTKAAVSAKGMRDGENALGNFVADVLRASTGADIGVINAGGVRAGLPAGAVTVNDIYSVLPFDNRIVVVTLRGWQVRELLDFISERIGKGGFAQVSGVKFTISRGRAQARKVGDEPLDSDRYYRVATIDFLLDGGDGYTQFAKGDSIVETGILLRDAAVRFLEKNSDYEFKKEARIRWEGGMPGFGSRGGMRAPSPGGPDRDSPTPRDTEAPR
jgi:2',3'-cyclic-nucleotide 2'-phosphodiesterase (5'-nucleotidase family)